MTWLVRTKGIGKTAGTEVEKRAQLRSYVKHGVDRVPQADGRYLPRFSFQIPVHDAASAEDALDKAARALSAHRRADFVRPDGTVSVNYMADHQLMGFEAARASISREAEAKAKRRQRAQERKAAALAVGTNCPRPSQ